MVWVVTGADPDALLSAAPDGDALEYANFRRRVWLPACELVNLEGLTFHDLRRANATALVHAGDLKTAQTRLGHSDPRLTLGVLRTGDDRPGHRCSRGPRCTVFTPSARWTRDGIRLRKQ
jgi:integrase